MVVLLEVAPASPWEMAFSRFGGWGQGRATVLQALQALHPPSSGLPRARPFQAGARAQRCSRGLTLHQG